MTQRAVDELRVARENSERAIADVVAVVEVLKPVQDLVAEAREAEEGVDGKNAVWFLARFLEVVPPVVATARERARLAPAALTHSINVERALEKLIARDAESAKGRQSDKTEDA